MTDSPAETSSMKVWAASMILRRSTVSASAPAASDSSMIGRVIEAWTRATIWAEAMEDIIQAAPTDWIRPPKLVARLVIQTARNTGWFSGASAPVRTRGGVSGAVMTRTGCGGRSGWRRPNGDCGTKP
ncbi:hypothetical protein D3C71_517120 [compost metagenome]